MEGRRSERSTSSILNTQRRSGNGNEDIESIRIGDAVPKESSCVKRV